MATQGLVSLPKVQSAEKQGPEGPCQLLGGDAYLPLRPLLSSVSGGRTTKRPSIGRVRPPRESPPRVRPERRHKEGPAGAQRRDEA
jgi:hypothetical protein